MNAPETVSGSLFASEFLAESVRELPQWEEARADLAAGIAARLRDTSLRRSRTFPPIRNESPASIPRVWSSSEQ